MTSGFHSTLKGKITCLEETCKALSEELTFYKHEISNLHEEKTELENNLSKKTSDIRNALVADCEKSVTDMHANHST